MEVVSGFKHESKSRQRQDHPSAQHTPHSTTAKQQGDPPITIPIHPRERHRHEDVTTQKSPSPVCYMEDQAPSIVVWGCIANIALGKKNEVHSSSEDVPKVSTWSLESFPGKTK